MASVTTASDFAQAITLFKTRGRYSDRGWVLSTYIMYNSLITIGKELTSDMLGYYVIETGSGSEATMTWEDVVSDPDGIILTLIAG